MSEDKKTSKKNLTIQDLREGYQPLKKGLQTTQGNLDSSNPPQGGSGVPSKTSNEYSKNDKKD